MAGSGSSWSRHQALSPLDPGAPDTHGPSLDVAHHAPAAIASHYNCSMDEVSPRGCLIAAVAGA
jgi:hypothetical protein